MYCNALRTKAAPQRAGLLFSPACFVSFVAPQVRGWLRSLCALQVINLKHDKCILLAYLLLLLTYLLTYLLYLAHWRMV